MSSAVIPSQSPPREALIDTAVRFLTNPSVVDRPFSQKQMFLKSKGMTDDEIRISCERADVQAPTVPHQQNSVVPMYGLQQHTLVPPQLGLWTRVRDILHTVALLGGLGYVIYWVYKSYIEPFLFGRPKPKKPTEESLSSLEEAVEKISRSTNELRTEFRSELSRFTQEREFGTARNLADIKSDIATVKGILLSRQQFPSAPSSTALRSGQTSKPSIPVWQMTEEQRSSPKEDDVTANGKYPSSHSSSEKPKDSSVMESSEMQDTSLESTTEK